MKTIIVLFAGMVWAATPAVGKGTEKPDPRGALEIIHARKSVRHFTGEAVGREELETLLRAGMAAPTAVNKQPWSFIVVTGRARLDSLGIGLRYARMLAKAGAAIVVCALPSEAAGKSREFAVIDAALASQNILLAAEALGLGALWTACYPDSAAMSSVRTRLDIPGDVIPLNVIPVGHPTGEDQPKDKFKAEKIHWEQW
jgi:nitroreductase